jgi:hypothetical protein
MVARAWHNFEALGSNKSEHKLGGLGHCFDLYLACRELRDRRILKGEKSIYNNMDNNELPQRHCTYSYTTTVTIHSFVVWYRRFYPYMFWIYHGNRHMGCG